MIVQSISKLQKNKKKHATRESSKMSWVSTGKPSPKMFFTTAVLKRRQVVASSLTLRIVSIKNNQTAQTSCPDLPRYLLDLLVYHLAPSPNYGLTFVFSSLEWLYETFLILTSFFPNYSFPYGAVSRRQLRPISSFSSWHPPPPPVSISAEHRLDHANIWRPLLGVTQRSLFLN